MFASLQAKLIALLAAMALSALGTWYITHRVDQAQYVELQNQYANAAIKAISDAAALDFAKDEAVGKIAIADMDARYILVESTKTIIKEVPKYVTPATDAAFPVPCGFVRVHDAAARGVTTDEVPNPPGKSDGDPCEFKASQVAELIADNYGAALLWRQQLVDLQAAVKAGQDIDNKDR